MGKDPDHNSEEAEVKGNADMTQRPVLSAFLGDLKALCEKHGVSVVSGEVYTYANGAMGAVGFSAGEEWLEIFGSFPDDYEEASRHYGHPNRAELDADARARGEKLRDFLAGEAPHPFADDDESEEH